MTHFLARFLPGARTEARALQRQYGISEEQIHAAFARVQMQNLPFVTSSLIFLTLMYALIQGLVLNERRAQVMVVIALVSAVLLVGLRLLIARDRIPPAWSNRVYGFLAGLVLLNMLVRLFLTADADQSANLAFFLVGVGMLHFTTRWFLFMNGVTLSGWLLGVLTLDPQDEWVFYGVVILAAAATGALAQIMLTSTFRESEVLRIVERLQRQELRRRAVQLETSAAVGQRITSILDLNRLLPQVAKLIQHSYALYYVTVVLLDGEGKLVTAAEAGADLPSKEERPLLGFDGPIGWVLREAEPLRITDLSQDPRAAPAEALAAARSELILPLRMGGRVLGVLDLQSEETAAFTAADVPVFQSLADQVATALENARLYEQTRQFNVQLEAEVQQRTRELQEAYDQLEKLDKTKTDFITIASHELRTPLTIVHFHTQVLLDDEEIQQMMDAVKRVRGIYKGAARMDEVVEAMLDVAKIDSQSLQLHPAPLNLHLLIRMTGEKFRPALQERQITLKIDDMKQLPEVEADSEALQKVFYHLLMNAIKYTPDGGCITVNGRSLPANEAPEQVEIVVADNGIGIAPEVQPLIFEKFYQTGEVTLHSSGKTKFKGGGAGLGLAIARGIVAAHNGRIWVESPGYDEKRCPGSAFYLQFPIQQ